MKIMTQDKTRVLNFKMTYISYVIETAKQAAGITEETNTFTKWKELGYKVQHGASALFGCSLIWGSRGDGATYKASFFGKSQVEVI